MVGHREWLDDDSLYSYAGRAQRRDELEAEIRTWCALRTTDEIVELASLLRVPVAPVGNGKTIPTFDHFVEQKFYVTNPSGGFLQPDVAYTLGDNASRRPAEPSPRLGEHTSAEREHDRAPRTVGRRFPHRADAVRGPPGRRLHRVLGRSHRRSLPRDARCRRRARRVGQASGRHPWPQRAHAERPVVVGVVAAVPRSEHEQARGHPRPRNRGGPGAGARPRRRVRRRARELLATRHGAIRTHLRPAVGASTGSDHDADAGVRAVRSVEGADRIRPEHGTGVGHGVGHRLPGRTAAPAERDVRSRRRDARDASRCCSRSNTAGAPAGACRSRWRWSVAR